MSGGSGPPRAPALDAREEAANARDEAADARDDASEAREDAVAHKEGDAAHREVDLARRERRVITHEAWRVELRDAKEHLARAAERADELGDEAAAAWAAAEGDRSRLAESDLALRDALRRKDELLAMLGHELRNPLAPILTALELIKMRPDQPSLHEHRVIERQVRRMVVLIDDLLDVARFSAGKLVLDRAPVEVSAVVEAAIEASPLVERRRHALCVRVPESGLCVCGDEGRLCQAIANLLTNAAKYTEPGGHISITAIREGAWARITVEDDGAGITAELLPRVFERFVQERQTSERAGGGLGLGLAIVKRLVEAHGGEVSAASEGPGRGSEFVLRLPAMAAKTTTDVDQTHAREAVPDGVPSRAEVPGPRRILLVDDNVDAVDMLAEALAGEGREISVAHDGAEALRLEASFAPDAVVLDIGLPLMDGYELARTLREREAGRPGRPHARLIALTGYGQESDRARSAEAGIDVHLVKPVDLKALDLALRFDAAAPSASLPHASP